MLNNAFLVASAALAIVVLLAVPFALGSADQELICHITDSVDPDTGCTIAVVIEVGGGAIQTHRDHGDPPAPAGAKPGDIIPVRCP